ncbi:MAG: hypothetical protein RR461_07390 [Angelakisella sp.]
MDVAITAIFATLEQARSAADCMAVCPGKEKNLRISMEHCDHSAVTAASRLMGGGYAPDLLDITPTSSAAVYRGQSALVRVRCSDQLSAFAAKELAALGAEKITITPLS